jgi:hypothetical protein
MVFTFHLAMLVEPDITLCLYFSGQYGLKYCVGPKSLSYVQPPFSLNIGAHSGIHMSQ